ncbi:nesprin-2 isoform X1 [Gadus morhua]|uniref:nesprin-2 isoform X1 n=1 Tax=Gadus morhua TaxID=8049 RepID=UPI0011B542ED|nr:nesprin-2-like isoform X1 [Gadus morhua]XP_030237714.1 nesprin-2-like isoform X1 [Gadus morhua]
MSDQEEGGSQELGDGSDWLVSLTEEEEEDAISEDGGLALQLDRRWVTWHHFMKEHAHLDAWLRLAEQAAGTCSSAHVTYDTAKDRLRTVERLQYEAGLRLVDLDVLTNQSRGLGREFRGAVRSRLLGMTRDAARRWDALAAALQGHARGLQSVVSEREEFEAEGAELGLWLADLDARLSELDHQTGNSRSKMKELQSFQACVCVSSQRVGVLLDRGETMMQRCAPGDAQEVESSLLRLLQRLTSTFSRITSTHRRLLSMRLVFEDDCLLSPAPDSGCPSESLLEEEGALDTPRLDLATSSLHPLPTSTLPASPLHPLPTSTLLSPELELEHNVTSCREPTHEHLGLEWDPSVDVGPSVTHGNEDSSYFSFNTGVCPRSLSPSRGEGRWPRPRSDVFDDVTNQEVDSIPDRQVCEPISFNGGRVRAWLGFQSSTPSRSTSCSRGVQTDGQSLSCRHDNRSPRDDALPSGPAHRRALRSPDPRTPQRDWMMYSCQSSNKSKVDPLSSDTQDSTPHTPQRLLVLLHNKSSRPRGLSSLGGPPFLYLLLAVALTLLACLLWGLLETPCHRGNRFPPGRLALTYVNGPPPT